MSVSSSGSMQQNLTQQEIDQCRKAFAAFDKDGSGTIDAKELRSILLQLGQDPSDDDLFMLMSQIDEDRSGEVEFHEFLRVIQNQKMQAASSVHDHDTLEAFVALGGNYDKTGIVSVVKLRQTIKDFELTINIDSLLKQMDKDYSGSIDFNEFSMLLGEERAHAADKPVHMA